MRKPDLNFFHHVIKETGLDATQLVLIDDTAENICAARSLGIHGLLVDNQLAKVGGTLRNLLQDPLPRAEAYLKANAGNHHCVIEGSDDTILKNNFSQLMIWDLTGDEDIIYLKWPSETHYQAQDTKNPKTRNGDGVANGNGVMNGDRPATIPELKKILWNYFYEDPILTTPVFPPDADTTSTAYLSIPPQYLSRVADVELVLDAMAANTDEYEIMQTYFSEDRPRINPEVCCNILRVFHAFGHGSDPRKKKTEDWVISCLKNKASLHGNRHYTVPEAFLYFVARLYVKCDPHLRKELEPVRQALEERLNIPTNPLALAMRIYSCQLVGVDSHLYQKDLGTLKALQDADGGWPAGHFCCMGRTGARIGNRGLATALARKVLLPEKLREHF